MKWCPTCGSGMDQIGKPYNVGSRSGGTTRVTMFKCSWCGMLDCETEPVAITPIMRDVELARFITFGRLQ